jgi:hypothetical protein
VQACQAEKRGPAGEVVARSKSSRHGPATRCCVSDERRLCPSTGGLVVEVWEHQRSLLGEFETLPSAFDVVVNRRAAYDCTVHFEGRAYALPFALVGQEIREIYGCAGKVEIRHQSALVARHPRVTAERIVFDPNHCESEVTVRVLRSFRCGAGRRLGS